MSHVSHELTESDVADPAERLLALARRNARERFPTDPNVHAAILTGSVARGRTDDASDVDTIVYLKDAASQEMFEATKARAVASGGGFYHGSPADGFGVYEFVDGVKCDFGYGSVAEFETSVETFLADPPVEGEMQTIVSGFLDAVPLHNAPWVEAWQDRLHAYPEALAERMVRHHLGVTPRWILSEMGLARDDFLFTRECFFGAAKRLVGVLLGVNRVYDPGKVKGIALTVSRLAHAPPDLLERLRALTGGSPAALEVLDGLVTDVYDLVDRHLPVVDTGPARERYRETFRRG